MKYIVGQISRILGKLAEVLETEQVVPNGVYWNADSQNFYSEETRQGLGTAFYLTWRDRSSEFPSCDGFGNRSNGETKC